MFSITPRLSTFALLVGLSVTPVAFAQTSPSEAPAAPTAQATTPAAETPATPAVAADQKAPVPSVLAQEKPFDPIVATVNGSEIRRSDLESLQEAFPQARSMPLESIYPALLDRLITTKLMTDEARKAKMLDLDVVKKRIAIATDQILQMAYLEAQKEKENTEELMKKRYDEEVAKMPKEEEIRAHHILVKTEKEAKAIIADLKKKKAPTFEELAKTKSKDEGTAPQGGDLGYFSLADMVPEFSEALKGMNVGDVSATPVKTQFGWHIIRLDDRRPVQPPAYDDVKEQVRAMLTQEKTGQLINALKTNAKIVEFNLDGSPKQ